MLSYFILNVSFVNLKCVMKKLSFFISFSFLEWIDFFQSNHPRIKPVVYLKGLGMILPFQPQTCYRVFIDRINHSVSMSYADTWMQCILERVKRYAEKTKWWKHIKSVLTLWIWLSEWKTFLSNFYNVKRHIK